MGKSAPAEPGVIQSVDRALRILLLFHQNKNQELSIRELSSQLNLNKSTVFCLLQTLKSRNFIQQNKENSKYSLGLCVMEIGLTMEAGLEIGSIARPFLEELVRCRPETAHLVIRDGDQVVYIDKISGTKTRSVGIVSYVGKRNPLHCTGVGKCILAYSSDDLIERILTGTLDRYTNNTITDPAELRLELEDIRKRGYSLDREEIEIGLKCVAAPIFGLRSQLIGAISLSCPSSIMPDEEMLKMIPSVIETARLISDQLGFKEKL